MVGRLDEMIIKLDSVLKDKPYEELDRLFSPLNTELLEKLAENSEGVRKYLDKKAGRDEDVIWLTPSLYIPRESEADTLGEGDPFPRVEDHMKKGEFGWAAYLAKKHNLGEDNMKKLAERAYEAWMKEEAFMQAASIAREYGLGEEKVRTAVEEGYKAWMKEGDYREAAYIANKYNLGEDKIYLANVLLGLTETQR